MSSLNNQNKKLYIVWIDKNIFNSENKKYLEQLGYLGYEPEKYINNQFDQETMIDIDALADSQVVKEPISNVKVEEIPEEEKKIVNVFEEKKLRFVSGTQQELHVNKINSAVVDLINDSNKRNELGLDFFRKKPILYLESTKDIDEEALEQISSNVLIYIKDGVSKELSNNRYTQQVALIYSKEELLDLIWKLKAIERGIKQSWSKIQIAAYLYDYRSTAFSTDFCLAIFPFFRCGSSYMLVCDGSSRDSCN